MFNHRRTQNNNDDYGFFASEEDEINIYGNNKNSSSKIMTKAVIERTPTYFSKTEENKRVLENFQRLKPRTHIQELSDGSCSSSPTSSEEKRLLREGNINNKLLNCLAYNEDSNDKEISSLMDDKYYSDNSLSDSTITTVTSDFTSVSQFSTSLDSSCISDENSNSPTPQGDVDKINPHDTATLDSRPDCVSEKTLIETPSTVQDENVNRKNVCKSHMDECLETKFLVNENEEDTLVFNPDSNRLTSIVLNHEHSNDQDENENNVYSKSYCTENSRESRKNSECSDTSLKKESLTSYLEDFEDISIASQSSTNSLKSTHFKGQRRKFRSKRREHNLTFSREELIKIERENLILLKKIMSYSKPRSVTLNHPFCHKKTSAAINRARQQKKIEQDNYVLYSKINALNRMKKVF